MTRDGSERVTYSTYNYSNQPLSTLTMENGISINAEYGYDPASGLASAITPFATSPDLDSGVGDMSGTETLEYRRQVIYRNGLVETVLFPGGYATLKGGGKGLTTANRLNDYDFGVRQYWHAIPGFNRIDPMCEKYYRLSLCLY